MKKIIVIIAIFLSLCLSLSAEHVSFEDARTIAQNWVTHLKDNFHDNVSLADGESIIKDGIEVAHVFGFVPSGYVIISAEDYLPPVKMYSLKNNFGHEGKEVEEMVFKQYREIIGKITTRKLDPAKVFMRKNKTAFDRLKAPRSTDSEHPARERRTTETMVSEVPPFVTTTWRQREPFNLFCPVLDGERCVVGCTATAFAQVMKYHEYPPNGNGSWSYQTRTHDIPVTASFSHPYHWDRMLDAYPEPDSGTQEQREAVAQLMFDVGASVNMNYSPTGSGAYIHNAVMAFPAFFGYSREIIHLHRWGRGDGQWFDLAKTQVDLGLPAVWGIYTEDAGHAVVIDGYRISDAASTVHINMGWGGKWDGYYSLNNITTDPYAFTVNDYQNCVLNMVPPDSGIDLPVLPVGGTVHENRSLFFRESFCELTWRGFPGPGQVDYYVILLYNIYTKEYFWWAEVNHTGQTTPYRHTFRLPDYNSNDTAVAVLARVGPEDWAWEHIMFCYLKTE
ncbi:MAG: hypothetical protein GY950_18710 [bacterium]|nr:hypothetical protein [bacterium]